ncbi:MAG: hypothetical protein JWP65_231 [Ramlibacter sp.]|jgi:hypothetical protein|uniref:hypothetical protein n=1 Tax=Ramlibacter sp. TaxID=1917967 RepID=UPI0026214AFA|nr:hypothetical protein [Ramlibacter sp.]MDB5749810.1 hypothetical protein [Ramlibacter sp.]
MSARSATNHLPAAVRRAAVRLLLVLALALVLAQALGLMHRITHFAPPGTGSAQITQPAEGNWVGFLFAGHAGESDCRLFDPLNHEGAPTVAVQVLPLVLSSFLLACIQGDFVARRAALFDARGPPVSR